MRKDEIYEDEDEINEKPKSALRFTRYVLVFILVIIILLFVFNNKDKLNIDNFRRFMAKIDIGVSIGKTVDNKTIDFQFEEESFAKAYKDGVAHISPSKLVITDNIGTKFLSLDLGYENPAMQTTKKYVFTYDRGGKNLTITNSFATVFEKKFDDEIIAAKMNDEGYFAVVLKSAGYKNEVLIFDKNFKEAYKWQSLNRYIVDVDISPSGDAFVVSTLNVENAKNKCEINYFKLNKKEMVWALEAEKGICSNVAFKDVSTISALFSDRVDFISSKGKKVGTFEFEDYILQSINTNSSRYTALVMSKSNSGASNLIVINNKGKKLADTETGELITSIDINDDEIALMSKDKVMLFSMFFKKINFTKALTKTCDDVYFVDKSSVITTSESCAIYHLLS